MTTFIITAQPIPVNKTRNLSTFVHAELILSVRLINMFTYICELFILRERERERGEYAIRTGYLRERIIVLMLNNKT